MGGTRIFAAGYGARNVSAETVSAAAAVGTFVVIAATAIAAVVQLRHMRAGNQLNAFMTIGQDFERPEFRELLSYVRNKLPAKMQEPTYGDEILDGRGLDRSTNPELIVCGFFEQMGLFMKRRLVDESVFLDAYAPVVVRNWERLSPYIALSRQASGLASWENFEYAAVRAYQWTKRHPNGTLPKSFPRLPISPPAALKK